MVKRYDFMMGTLEQCERLDGDFVEYEDYAELEAENARLRQQRDAANAQLDWLIEQTGTKRAIRANMGECE